MKWTALLEKPLFLICSSGGKCDWGDAVRNGGRLQLDWPSHLFSKTPRSQDSHGAVQILEQVLVAAVSEARTGEVGDLERETGNWQLEGMWPTHASFVT